MPRIEGFYRRWRYRQPAHIDYSAYDRPGSLALDRAGERWALGFNSHWDDSYSVSDHGRVRSDTRVVARSTPEEPLEDGRGWPSRQTVTERIMVQAFQTQMGLACPPRVRFTRGTQREVIEVAELVWRGFGPMGGRIPEGMIAGPKDGNFYDCHISNLELMTEDDRDDRWKEFRDWSAAMKAQRELELAGREAWDFLTPVADRDDLPEWWLNLSHDDRETYYQHVRPNTNNRKESA